MLKIPKHVSGKQLFSLSLLAVLTVSTFYLSSAMNRGTSLRSRASYSQTVESKASGGNTINFDKNEATVPGSWIGNGSSSSGSYLGLRFSVDLPPGSIVSAATLSLSPSDESWIAVSFDAFAVREESPKSFRSRSKIADYTLSSSYASHSDNVKWSTGKYYSYDVSDPVKEVLGFYPNAKTLTLMIKGTGGAWGRKFIQTSGSLAPKITIEYSQSAPETPPPPTQSPAPTPTPGSVSAQIYGDCNGDRKIDAGDTSALSLEIDDGDGYSAGDATGGSFAGSEYCDANYDYQINQIDFTCLNRKIFEGVSACDEFSAPISSQGDCNGDNKVDAGDLSAISNEVYDGDGTNPLQVHNGTFSGYRGCDANNDGVVNDGDTSCIQSIIFGDRSCTQ